MEEDGGSVPIWSGSSVRVRGSDAQVLPSCLHEELLQSVCVLWY
ncbi:hypothetical protein [Paenibacillus albidus]|nr:hypothetical protein [Paenibacillus albidus]